MAETRWTNDSMRYDAPEREDEDLGQVQGVFYRVLRPEEVPFWLLDDAEEHMALLTAILQIPAEPIEFFVPALYDEVPEVFVRHVHDTVTAAPQKATWVIWSDTACSPRIVNPVYLWRGFEVLGFTDPDIHARGIFLRADMPRTGRDGFDFDIAHEMKHRQQAYQCAIDGEAWSDGNECERDADAFAGLYMESVVLGQDEAQILSPELGEALMSGCAIREREALVELEAREALRKSDPSADDAA